MAPLGSGLLGDNNGFAWVVSIDGEEYGVETNTHEKGLAIREAIIAQVGMHGWSDSAFVKYRSKHDICIIKGPSPLFRKAYCYENGNFD